ncbi:FMRFamide receptor [Eurytemora carolleeae]|uniref:FMRFamide receptor n=1 Tax=Eurytemora carolleeae TaxID=1294199 RepID=UPI000C780C0B|nr:FMRFamide receptor [Eurytemora carolleeae]|eukprot:XP_023332149.1 FMRFamide receptor-like [Eurytemora affinis]
MANPVLEEFSYFNNCTSLVCSDELVLDYLDIDLDNIKYWAEGVLLTIISVFGITTNAIRYDILYLVTSIFLFGLPELSEEYRNSVYAITLPYIFGLGHIGRVGSVFLTLSITIERFVAVTRPLYTEKERLKNILMVGSATFSILYNIPSVSLGEMNDSMKTIYIPAVSSLRTNTTYLTIHFWSKLVLVELGPYVLLTTLNIIIIIRARQSSQIQPRSAQASKKELQMVQILLLIVIMFVICQSFKIIPDLYEVFQCSFGERRIPACWENPPKVVNTLSIISHLALSINSSVNFFVYVAWGSKFRKALMRLIQSKFRGSRNEDRQNLELRMFNNTTQGKPSPKGDIFYL